jgi:hypothetical protein
MEDGKRGAVTPSTPQRREGLLRLQQSGGVRMETAMEADRMPHRSFDRDDPTTAERAEPTRRPDGQSC